MKSLYIAFGALIIGIFSPQIVLASYYTLPITDYTSIGSYFDHTTPQYGSDQYPILMTRYNGTTGASYDGHNGIDYLTGGVEGKDIFTAGGGVVRQIQWQDPDDHAKGYGYFVRLWHESYNQSTLYAHLRENSEQGIIIGNNVARGQLIAKSGNTGRSTGPHLHFSVFNVDSNNVNNSIDPYGWSGNGQPDLRTSDPNDVYTSDPWTIDQGYLWTTNPPSLSASTPSTSWNFNSSIEGWSAVNATDYGIDSGSFWKFNPGIDPQLISPQLSAVNASSYKIFKIVMDVPGTGSDTGKVFFKNNINDAWTSSKSVSFDINKSDSGQQIYYVQMRDAPNNSWTGQIAQIRIDPVVNYPSDNTGSIYLDSVTFESANDANTFVAQSDYPTVVAGQNFSIFFTVQNTGNTKWDSNYSLKLDPGIQNNNVLGASNPTPVSGTVLPGLGADSNYTFNLNMTAPAFSNVYRTGWRMAKPDGTLFGASMYIDVIIAYAPVNWTDYDGDNKGDTAIWRPSNGYWGIINSSTGQVRWVQWGSSGDIPVPADYDNDGKSDVAIWRSGLWGIIDSSTGQVRWVQWGANGDIPVPADYDNDGKADVAIWRSGLWGIIDSSTGQVRWVQWGSSGDIPTPADYDNDGKSDIAIWRNGLWGIIDSSTGQVRWVSWGTTGDTAVPSDYDGDGKADTAIWRPSGGAWCTINSSNGSQNCIQWGASGDIAAPDDYDGDLKTDKAIWRNGLWGIINSKDGSVRWVQWGSSGDVPV